MVKVSIGVNQPYFFRLLKNTGHKNSYNTKKERRTMNDAQATPENTEYTSDK